MHSGFLFLHSLGFFFQALFLMSIMVGAILLIIWSTKVLSKQALKKTGIYLVLVGVVGALIICGFNWISMNYVSGGGWKSPRGFVDDRYWDTLNDGKKESWMEYMKERMEESPGFEAL